MKIIRPIRNVVQETRSRQGAFTGAVLRKNKVIKKKFFLIPVFYWNIVDLQCRVSLCSTAK